MKICHLSVQNFRGIKELDWFIERDINCLIGPGDSTKSTILASIYYALLPTWNPTFRDSDFYNQDVTQSIKIVVTMKELPLHFRQRFDRYKRGLLNDQIIDEPTDESEVVWSLKLEVNENLEPSWTVFTERPFDIYPSVSASDRRALSVYRLGGVYDSDFSWMKGSALTRMSDQENDLRIALRAIRQADNYDPASHLRTVAGSVQTAACGIGVIPATEFKPGIDTQSLEDNRGVLSLHDGDVPMRMKGKGTKRLIAMAIHKGMTDRDGILTIDEIESGLEPYRLRHLIRALREAHDSRNMSQVFATTHSDIAVVEFRVDELSIVFCDQETGHVTIKNIPNDGDLQSLLRSHNEAVLGKKIIVCEGKTECGFLIGIDEYRCSKGEEYFSSFGAVPTDLTKGVDQAVQVALKVNDLGYETAIFIDSDVQPGVMSIPEIEAKDIKVFQWPESSSTEQIIFRYVDDVAFHSLLEHARTIRTEDTFANDLAEALVSEHVSTSRLNATQILSLPITTPFRNVVGNVAKNKSWFKDRDRATTVGKIVAQFLERTSSTPLHQQMDNMLSWVKS